MMVLMMTWQCMIKCKLVVVMVTMMMMVMLVKQALALSHSGPAVKWQHICKTYLTVDAMRRLVLACHPSPSLISFTS